MRILLTNDDGIFAEGLRSLARALSSRHDVQVVAPDRERSASSHALTLDRPLRIQEVDRDWFAVTGTPTDCVNIGVLHLMRSSPPDVVVSGINFGLNVGDDVTYSGTVSATFEGNILGLPSLAFSQEVGSPMPFERAADVAVNILDYLDRGNHFNPGLMLNINIPAGEIRGVRWTHLGKRHYQEGIVEKVDPRGKKYYWIGGAPEPPDLKVGTDFHALDSGFVSLTPLHLDLTDYETLAQLEKEIIEL